MTPKYEYEGWMTECVDGDTLDLILKLTPRREVKLQDRWYYDLGFGHYVRLWEAGDYTLFKHRFRLYGIDAPEKRGEEREGGLKSMEWLKNKLNCRLFDIKVYKKGKYGRYLCEIFVGNENVNQTMITEGLAEIYPT